MSSIDNNITIHQKNPISNAAEYKKEKFIWRVLANVDFSFEDFKRQDPECRKNDILPFAIEKGPNQLTEEDHQNFVDKLHEMHEYAKDIGLKRCKQPKSLKERLKSFIDQCADDMGISPYAAECKVWQEAGFDLPREIYDTNRNAFNYRNAVIAETERKNYLLRYAVQDALVMNLRKENKTLSDAFELGLNSIHTEMALKAAELKLSSNPDTKISYTNSTLHFEQIAYPTL